jgi:hypothetical protein
MSVRDLRGIGLVLIPRAGDWMAREFADCRP